MVKISGVSALLSYTLLTHTRSIHLRHDPENTTTLNRWLTDDPRIFFFAGIEGSGAKVFQEIWWQHYNDTRYPSDHDKAHHILHFPAGWSCGDTWTDEHKAEMVAKLDLLQTNEIWSLPYKATYPSCGAWKGKKYDRMHNFHPHLDWLQEAADAAGVKLHVIYLRRPLAETLALDCVDRHYDRCDSQAETIVENAKILKFQMDNLTNDAVSCFQYFDEDKMQEEIHARFDIRYPPRLDKIFKQRKLGDDVDKLGGAKKAVEHWDGIMDNLCKTMDTFTLADFHYILTRTEMETDHFGEHRKKRRK